MTFIFIDLTMRTKDEIVSAEKNSDVQTEKTLGLNGPRPPTR